MKAASRPFSWSNWAEGDAWGGGKGAVGRLSQELLSVHEPEMPLIIQAQLVISSEGYEDVELCGEVRARDRRRVNVHSLRLDEI